MEANTTTKLCECVNWCGQWVRFYGKTLTITNHHPNCPHYNDSQIDVWKVEANGRSCYVDNEQDANDSVGDCGIISKEKMHREVFEHLPDFEGF